MADKVVITNDNPRSENPEQIAQQVASAASQSAQIQLDRKQAILGSIEQARNNDWVLIAGKGHELTQQIGTEYLPFSDRELVSQAVSA